MIKFDYEIIRDEKDETKTYTPQIPKKFDDLVTIEGPNSSGKSTLLHILALGLYGRKNKRIKPSLKRKLNDLMEAKHQRLTFSVEIYDKKNGLKIVAEKPDLDKTQINVYEISKEKKKPLSFESFDRKYRLIYDVPENPLERLNELAYELKDIQNTLGIKVNQLMLKLRDVLEEITRARNPAKIKKFKEDITKLNLDLRIRKTEKKDLDEETSLIGQFFHCSLFLEKKERLSQIKAEVEDVKKQLKKNNKDQRQLQRKEMKFISDLTVHKDAMRTLFNGLISNLRKAKIKTKDNYIDLWKDKNIEDILDDEEKRRVFSSGINAFREKASELDRESEDDEKLNEANLLDDLIGVLEHYANTKIIVPGIETTVQDFIRILNEKVNEYKEIKAKHRFYSILLQQLDNLKVTAKRYINFFLPQIHEFSKDAISDKLVNLSSIESRIKDLNKEREKCAHACEYHKEEFIKLGIKESQVSDELDSLKRETCVKPYIYDHEDELEDKIRSLKESLIAVTKQIKEDEQNLYRWQRELERLAKKEPHQYQDYQNELNAIFVVTQKLEQRLVHEYEENIRYLIERDRKGKRLTEQQKRYFDSVSTYLATKVGELRHIDKSYQVTKIDLIGGKVYTESGKTIFLTDFGTGQSQSAYLKGLLKTTDNRKIIALIDEVAMMDTSSMQPIYDLLIEQYKKEQLLASVIIQKGEKLKVKPIC